MLWCCLKALADHHQRVPTRQTDNNIYYQLPLIDVIEQSKRVEATKARLMPFATNDKTLKTTPVKPVFNLVFFEAILFGSQLNFEIFTIFVYTAIDFHFHP